MFTTPTPIWQRPISLDILNTNQADTVVGYLGIEFTEVGPDFIRARVPVDARTRQPYGLLHGGVSVVLAETLGSCGAAYSCPEPYRTVGLDINANHLRGVSSGWVTGTARPVHWDAPPMCGKSTWSMRRVTWSASRASPWPCCTESVDAGRALGKRIAMAC